MTQLRNPAEPTRLGRGSATLAEVNGRKDRGVASYRELGRYVFELVSVAASTTMGGREPQPKVHIGGATNYAVPRSTHEGGPG